MSNTEIAVAAIGLLTGFWIVSALLKSGKDGPPQAAQDLAPEVTTPPRPWHEVLQVAEDASVEKIHAAYEAQRAGYLPERVQDLGPALQEVARRKTAEIAQAYAVALRARGVEPPQPSEG